MSNSALAVDDEIEDVAFEQHLGSADSFEILRNDAGEILSIVGRFDAAGESDHTVAVTNFLSQLGIAAPDLRLREVQPIDNETDVARFDQYLHGLRCLDAEVSVAFAPNGDIRSINGVLHPAAQPTIRPSISYVDVLDRVAETGLEPLTDGAWIEVSKNRWENDFGFSIEYGWSTTHSMATWQYIDDQVHLEVSDNGIVTNFGTEFEGVTGPCNIRVRDYSRDSNGRAVDFEESSATRTEQVTCEASEWFGTCTWQLRREGDLGSHTIGRVQDDNGVEQEVEQSCSSGTAPQFANTNGDALREQGAFYTEAQMRYFINQNVWSKVAASSSSNVQITVDDDTNEAPALFHPFYTDIWCNSSFLYPGETQPINGYSQDILAHEYGHYVNLTYGDFSEIYNASDHGNSMEETMATAAGLIYILDDDQTKAKYGSIGGMIGNLPSAHITNGYIEQFNAQLCDGPTEEDKLSNQRIMGLAFNTALWEVLWNKNCTFNTCAAADTAVGATIFPTLTSQEQILEAVGSAFAYAESVLGKNVTYQQFVSKMAEKVQSQHGVTAANRFRAVFAHHGL